MLHALFLLLLMLLAAPLIAYVPLAALAGVLALVAWNMLEFREIGQLVRTDRIAAAACIITLLVTVLRDLLEGIGAGLAVYLLGRLVLARRSAAA